MTSINSPEISVIIPVYNVEKYLRTSLDSVLNQTFRDIEIILIDDCSQDDSLHICQEYAAKDSRIVIVSHPQNMGVCNSRNTGLAKARGKYIMFMDSDDFIDASMYEKLHTAITREKADMAGCNAWSYEPDGSKHIIRYFDVIKDENISLEKLGDKIYNSPFHIWRYIYKKEVLQNLQFRLNVGFADDAMFLMELYPHIKNIYCLAEPLYFYRRNNTSLSYRISSKNLDVLNIPELLSESFNTNSITAGLSKGFWNWYMLNLTYYYDVIPTEKQGYFLDRLHKILPYKYYQSILKYLEESSEKYYLFNMILLLTVCREHNKTRIKLFGKIPLCKIKHG